MNKSSFSSWPSYTKDEIAKVSDVLKSNKVNYWTGNECKNFETEFARFISTKYAVSLANGTIALDLALKSLGIGSGDEVIVTSRTFIASVSSIINIGASPVFADICLNSQNIISSDIQKKITRNTKAILCVHLAGYPCEMNRIMKIAKEYKLSVIEDCAQAHGAKYRGKPVGSIGDIGCWSFCQDKIMTTGGEGGMITTNKKKLWELIWSMKDHGKSYNSVFKKKQSSGFRWVHDSFGGNYRMNEIQASLGRIQLKRMKEWTRKRNKNQSEIWNKAKSIPGLRVPKFNETNWRYYHEGNVHAAYKCYLFVEKKLLKKGWSRDRIADEINKKGVPCFSGSCSEVYIEKAFKGLDCVPKKRLKNAKELGETSLMFQIHPTLTEDEIKFTCSTMREVMCMAVSNN